MWWSGYVLLRATPQGRFLSVREYPRHSKKVNPSPRKHDLEERVAVVKGNLRKEMYESYNMQNVLQWKKIICSRLCWLG